MSLKILLLGRNLSREAQSEPPNIKKIVKSVKSKNHTFLSGSLAKCYSEEEQVQDTKIIHLNSDQSLLLVAGSGTKLYSGLKSVDDGVAFVVAAGEQIVAHAGRYSSGDGEDEASSGGVFLHVGPRSLVRKFEDKIRLQGNNLTLGAVAAVVKVMRAKEISD